MRSGRFWMRRSRFWTVPTSWSGGEVAQAVFHVRPHALGRVVIRGVGGQLDDGQPVRVRPGELAHHGADVRVQVFPVLCPAVLCGRRRWRSLSPVVSGRVLPRSAT